ncbi:MAG: hypothetical protein HS111_37245 [Kofleriaceae bacterium]|nr:hypothetical protein [Kofleriaceae bacterium]
MARLALVELRAAREAELQAALAAAEDALEAARRALTAAETRRCRPPPRAGARVGARRW